MGKVITQEHVDAAHAKGHAKGTKEATAKALAAVKLAGTSMPEDKAAAKHVKTALAAVVAGIKATPGPSTDIAG